MPQGVPNQTQPPSPPQPDAPVTSIPTETSASTAMPSPITVPVFSAMRDAGLLEGVRVELWDGTIRPRPTPSRPHSVAVTTIHQALLSLRIAGVAIEQGQPLAFRRAPSAPCPDLAILRGRSVDFPRSLPTSPDVALLVEVADSTLLEDRRKVQSYARERIPVSWIVDLPDRLIEVSDLTGPNAYGPPAVYREDAEVPIVIDGDEVGRLAVRDVLV